MRTIEVNVEAGKVQKNLREGQELVDAVFTERVASWIGRVNHALHIISKGKADAKDTQALSDIRDFLAKYVR